ncbi:mandelate racemase/muconate lactonizing enzyme family protein [Alicyclobacillus dauci]|uniref:Mandelate racemase/muconate lactonizing enzyme family protein n=1 Tax=Alicyclobacillus dauci TaxID=1475485 RepID=A0ABY6YX79_9BACL|nr:mandelate racemase/muconate lactonizing enzyme family protein [Alicyclobacillus dauci]WAH35190.1 mandelate racemase/muconate lactonizing enzyme family protein [Alicyclobacillus dauci]
MKIADVRSHIVGNKWKNWIIFEVTSDEGISGFGEATLEHRTMGLVKTLEDLKPDIIGTNIWYSNSIIEKIRRETYTPGILINTLLAGVEAALLDLQGKVSGLNVTQLLGGSLRPKVRVYANGWYRVKRTPEGFSRAAQAVIDKGYTALKFDPFGSSQYTLTFQELKESLEIIRAVRETAGNGIDLIIEGHARFYFATAYEIAKRIADFGVLWFEEPVLPYDLHGLREIIHKSPVPIGTGERLFRLEDFREVLECGPLAVIQPDIVHVGGLRPAQKIAALAESFGVPVAFHNPQGPISSIESILLSSVCPNSFIQEYFGDFDEEWTKGLISPEICVKNGYIDVTTAPGLGIEFCRSTASQHPYNPMNRQNLFGSDWQLRKGRNVQ